MVRRRGLLALPIAALARPVRAEGGSTLERVRQSKTLRVGVVAGQPPYAWRDAQTGAWTGFIIDMATDFAAGLGAAVAPVESTWGNAVLDVQFDKVDVFFCLAPTPQRALAVDFTRPLFDNAFALIARPGFAPTRWEELNDPSVRVAVELGTVYDQNIATLCPKASVTRVKTNNDALLSIGAGRADCQIIVVILGLTMLAKNPALGHLVVPQPVFASQTAAMAAKQPSPAWRDELDEWIGRRRAAGELRRMLVANLERAGVRGADVPAELLF